MSRRITALTLLLLALLLLAAAGLLQSAYDARRGYFDERLAFVSLPSGKALRILSLGHRNFLADLLYIWSIQFYSSYNIRNRYEYIERVFDTITDVSPEYREPYIVGALIMVYEKGDVPMALRLLDKGSRMNPREWIFDMEAGYYAFHFLHQLDTARRLYERAAAKPNAPDLLRRKQAHMVYLENDLDQAWQMWLDIYRNADDRISRDAAFSHLYQIKFEMDSARLQEGIASFRSRFGRLPRSLEEMQARGMLAEIPRDFAGGDYRFDAERGQIRASLEFRWKKYW